MNRLLISGRNSLTLRLKTPGTARRWMTPCMTRRLITRFIRCCLRLRTAPRLMSLPIIGIPPVQERFGRESTMALTAVEPKTER
jgi:hypothetical protein